MPENSSLKQTFYIAGFVFLMCAALLLVLQNRLLREVRGQLVQVGNGIDEQYDISFSYRSLSMYPFQGIQVNDLEIDVRGERVAAVDHVRVRFQLRDVFSGTPLSLLRSLVIENAYLTMSMEQLEHIQTLVGAAPPGGGGVNEVEAGEVPFGREISQLLSDNRSVDIVRSSVQIDAGVWRYQGYNINVHAGVTDGELKYSLRSLLAMDRVADGARAEHISRLNHANSLQLKIEGNAAIVDGYITADAGAGIEDVRIGALALQDREFALAVERDRVELRSQGGDSLEILASYAGVPLQGEPQVVIKVVADDLLVGDVIDSNNTTVHIPEQLQVRYFGTIDANIDTIQGGAGAGRGGIEYTASLGTRALAGRQNGLELSLDAQGDQGELVIEQITASLQEGRVVSAAVVDLVNGSARGNVFFDEFQIAGSPRINGELFMGGRDPRNTVISGTQFQIGNQYIANIEVDISQEEAFSNIVLTTNFDEAASENASVLLQYYPDPASASTLAVILDNLNVNRLLGLASDSMPSTLLVPPDAGGRDLRINTSSSLRFSDDAFELLVNNLQIMDMVSSVPLVAIDGHGDETEIVFDNIMVAASAQQVVQGQVFINRLTPDSYDIRVDINDEQNVFDVNMRYRRGQFIRVTDSEYFRGVALFNDSNGTRVNFSAVELPIVLNDYAAAVSLSLTGYYDSISDWELSPSPLRVTATQRSDTGADSGAAAGVLLSTLTASLSAYPTGVFLDDIEYIDAFSPITGDASLLIGTQDSSFRVELMGESLTEQIRVSGVFLDNDPLAVRSEIDIDNLLLRRFLGNDVNVSGGINMNIIVDNQGGGGLDVSGEISSNKIATQAYNLDFSTQVAYRGDTIQLYDIRADAGGYQVLDGLVGANVATGHVYAELPVTQMVRRSIIASDQTVVITPYPLIDVVAEIDGQLYIDEFGQIQRLDDLLFELTHKDGFVTEKFFASVHYRESEGEYVLAGGQEKSLSGSFSPGTGRVNVQAAAPFPVTLNMFGQLHPGKVDISIFDIHTSVDRVPRIADIGFLRFIQGGASGSVRLVTNETTGKIETYGALVAEDLYLDVTYVPYRVGPINGQVLLQRNEIRIPRLFAMIEEEWGAYFSSSFVINGGVLEEYLVNIATVGDQTIPMRYTFNNIAVDALAQGHAELRGAYQSLNISGSVIGQGGKIIVSRNRQRPEEQAENLANINSMDLEFFSGTQFELRWPADDFPVIKAFPEPGERIVVQLSPVTRELNVEGSIAFQGGEIFYYDRNFLVNEGSVVMARLNGVFDPIIDLSAELRELAENGPVSIYLIIEDDLLSQLQPRLESVPPLTQSEVTLLLGGNILDPEIASTITQGQQAIEFAGDVLARLTVLNDFENSLRDVLSFFDILTIRTQLFQNILFDFLGTDVSPILIGQNTLARYLNNTDLYLGKYIANKAFFQLQLGLRDESINGYANSVNNLSVVTELSVELQSPLGVVSWNLSPVFEQPFRINNAVELSWSYAY